MAILETPFYHKTIHLYSAVFGTIFNNVSIVRSDGKTIKVPLAYAGQQKHNVRNDENPDPDAARYAMRLPRMSYRLTGWQKDESRITNKNFRLVDATVDRSTGTGVSSQYNRVPYNFQFELAAKTKNMDDLLQIVEQIVVYFNPSIQVVVNDNPDISGDTAINISLDDSSMNDDFAGDYETTRVLEATFTFTVEGYLYMPTSGYGVIQTIHLNYYDLDDPDSMVDYQMITEADL